MREGEFPDGAHCCARRSTWRRRTSTCATRCCIESGTRTTTGPATSGASIRCTTTRIRSADAIEGITHSICTLEFEDHRPLYDWLIEQAAGARASAADRIRAAQPDLHGDEQAQAAAAGAGGARHGLGRSADADDLRAAPPRLHARSDARVLRTDRRREAREHRSISRCSKTRSARISTSARRA